jgi:hypothetical protein
MLEILMKFYILGKYFFPQIWSLAGPRLLTGGKIVDPD